MHLKAALGVAANFPKELKEKGRSGTGRTTGFSSRAREGGLSGPAGRAEVRVVIRVHFRLHAEHNWLQAGAPTTAKCAGHSYSVHLEPDVSGS